MVVKRFDVYLVTLDPPLGSEMQKTRPCLIVSPDEMNRNLQTVLVVPLTGVLRGYPCRIRCGFEDRTGELCMDQLRAVDVSRLARRLGRMDSPVGLRALTILREIFSE